jgi:hypothetical protein
VLSNQPGSFCPILADETVTRPAMPLDYSEQCFGIVAVYLLHLGMVAFKQ